MAGGDPEKGDKVSWNWGGGKPGGTVSEKKTEGAVAITTKRGNTVKKNATPGNPAVRISRSGNDVVKKASELHIEKKSGGDSGSNTGKKRKRSGKENGPEEPLVENKDGKEVKAGGKKMKATTEKQKNRTNVSTSTKHTGKKMESKAASGKMPKPQATEGVSSRTRSRT